MKVHLVTVMVGNSLNKRYFDSIWVRKENADERVAQLRMELARAGIPVESDGNPTGERWAVRATEAIAPDGQIAEAKDAE
jgi:hypothetical protein